MDFPEGSDMKAPGEFRVSLGSLISLLFRNDSFFLNALLTLQN
jgi:hypothetical protein